MSDRLRETGQAAIRLGRLAGEVAQAAEAGREVSSGSLDPLIGRLYETDDRFNDHMRTINVGVRELAATLSAASQALTLHEELERVAEYVTGHFQRVESETLAVPAPDELVSRLDVLSQDHARYAMSSQRDVHEAFTASLAAGDEGDEEITAEEDVDGVLFSGRRRGRPRRQRGVVLMADEGLRTHTIDQDGAVTFQMTGSPVHLGHPGGDPGAS